MANNQDVVGQTWHHILDGCKRLHTHKNNENKGSQPNGAQQKKNKNLKVYIKMSIAEFQIIKLSANVVISFNQKHSKLGR
jgi:predicted glycosyltransferase involved in capsule biosynthesis